MDKELEIGVKYTLTSSGYERFMAGRELNLAEWVWVFEALLHAGCDIESRWAVVKQQADSHPDRQGLPPIQLNTLEEQLATCELYDSMTDEDTKADHLHNIDSIKRELAKL